MAISRKIEQSEILWKWTAYKFPDWDQVLWKGEENPFEKSVSHYKSCSASFIQRVRRDIRSIVCWDIYSIFTHKIWNCRRIQFLDVLTYFAPDVHLAEEQKAGWQKTRCNITSRAFGKKLMLLWVVLWYDTQLPCTRIVSQLNWICPDKSIVLWSGNILK